jgi:pimeloyl-ACP methyl ester carboxylesterase
LDANRQELCRLLWRMWSPNWTFDEATFARTAASWDNPDFVDVVIHSYRHRYAQADGDPALAHIEARLAAQPSIAAPTIVLHGEADAVWPPADSEHDGAKFTGPYQRRLVPLAGHFLPQEAPDEVVAALRELLAM